MTFWGTFIKPTPTFLQKIKLPFYYLGDSFQDIGDFSCSLFYFLPAYLSKAQYQFRTKTQINLKTPKKPQGDNTLYQRSNPTPPYTYTPSYYSLSNSITTNKYILRKVTEFLRGWVCKWGVFVGGVYIFLYYKR